MLTTQELSHIIDSTISSIWVNEIKADYEAKWLLKEDTLKNALYFHLRKAFGSLMTENNVRIYTEFTDGEFKHSGYRPDMVIARVDPDKDVAYWGDAVTECIAVIELKYKTGFTASENIYADYEKLQHYIEALNTVGRLYMATIWEYEDDETSWLEGTPAWAKGRVTELNASYKRNADQEMRFYVCPH